VPIVVLYSLSLLTLKLAIKFLNKDVISMKRFLVSASILCLFTQPGLPQKNKEVLVSRQALSGNIKGLAAGCATGKTVTELSLNNVRTWARMDGVLWSAPTEGMPGYEIPKNSGKSSIYSGGIWIGGTDINGQLKLCSSKYTGVSNYWPGPLKAGDPDRGTTEVEVCYQYDRHFPVSRFDVAAFRKWYTTPLDKREKEFIGYSVPQTILDWPAHGDAAAGYDFNLAPYWDNNNDGLYFPGDGDYPFYDLDGVLPCGSSRESRIPRLYGDATIWWVINDRGNIHQFPYGEAIGLEIRTQAFQYSANDAVNDMSFYNFTLINRSTFTLYDTYVGVYADGDIGSFMDDFAGCDVSKGIGYFYNGDAIDGDGKSNEYGNNPPAIGFDFFEGPYQDPNGLDDCTSYDDKNNLICNDCILNGSISGLNFYDGIVDNERWGMTGFFNINISTGCVGCDDSSIPLFYYRYLKGYWRDDQHMRYGGNGHPNTGGTGPDCSFGFPGDSDPCGWGQGGIVMPPWTEETAGNEPGDRRMIQSSGPFKMEPGAVNDMTIGVVWARSYDGGLMASVNKMLLADEKAQRLFENCFQVVDGPDAPELTIVEQDQKLSFHIWNKPSSNNFLEKYRERDPFIICPVSTPDCDAFYSFEGYQVWQIKNPDVPLSEVTLHNELYAREVFQTDIRNGAGRLINFYWDPVTESSQSVIEVSGSDQGIQHSFEVSTDAFAEGDHPLVNFKKYHFVAMAYAYNNYLQYGQSNMESLEGQKLQYLAGRKGADGPVKVYEAIPHKIEPEGLRLVGRAEEISQPIIAQIEGFGSGRNNIEISQATHDEIMKGAPWKAGKLEFEPGRGPIKVSVVDPMNVQANLYTLKLDSVNSFISSGYMNGKLIDANWFMVSSQGDTVFSESWIASEYEQLIPQWGLSVSINQVVVPFQAGAIDNGFIDATITLSDPGSKWLSFISDEDRGVPRNWIRSGYNDGDSQDNSSVYEKILGGTWTPFRMASSALHGPAYEPARFNIGIKSQRLNSIDLYITSDRRCWTRSPVLETTDDWRLSAGQAEKFDLRIGQSIDKTGKPAIAGSGASENENDPNYISETGMGWFPGYAIDVETGERLNIVYGESSFLTGDHGADMAWNPSAREGSKLYEAKNGLESNYSDVFFGGKHFIYIMGHNRTMPGKKDPTSFPGYDAGTYYMEKMATASKDKRKELLANATWTAIPILDTLIIKEKDSEDDLYGFLPAKSDLKIRLRVTGQYCRGTYDFAVPDSLAQNNNNPMYTINTRLATHYVKDHEVSIAALDLIRVVPNPYYGYSEYQRTEPDNRVKITNLPKSCTISVYSLNGNLIRRFNKENDCAFVDWDLKNQNGIQIASGAYIVYVDAPGIGHKVVKFFGAVRSQQLP
jgi:hypothetical protein